MNPFGENRLLVGMAVLSILAACGGRANSPEGTPPLVVKSVDWNPRRIAVSEPVTLVERGEEFVVFAKGAATVVSSGSQLAIDRSVPMWRGGAVISAPYGTDTWIVGVGDDGCVFRLRDELHFEPVSDRFGLSAEPVRAVCNLGPGQSGFLMDAEIAVADGARVTRFVDVAHEMACGGGVMALAEDAGIRVLAMNIAPRSYAIGPAHVAVTPDGKVWAGTSGGVYTQNAKGDLTLLRETAESVNAIVATKDGAWFLEGEELGRMTATRIEVTRGAKIPVGSRLVASANGDVWVINNTGVSRFSEDHGRSPAEQWNAQIGPLFAKSCQPCHGPGASSGTELSTFGEWDKERATILKRVIEQKSMPPPGVPFSEEDRQVIRRWGEAK